jgi:hypothetical protein
LPRGNNEDAILKVRCWAFDVGRSAFFCQVDQVEAAKLTADSRAGLRITIAPFIGATKALARRASHDFNGDCRYSALDRFRISHWNFLRVHAVVSIEDALVDRCGVDFPLQQDRGGNRGDFTRCRDLGDAGNLCCRVSYGILDPEPASSATCAFSGVPASRLRALACFFSSGVADVLASIRWLAIRRGPFGDICLLRYAPADQSRSSTAENGLNEVERTRWSRVCGTALPLKFAPSAVCLPSSSEP